jgi:hypothetical protein
VSSVSRIARALAPLAAAAFFTAPARADFDEAGNLQPGADAAYFESFDAPEEYFPESATIECQVPHFEVVTDDTAIEGGSYVRVETPQTCGERFRVELPATQASYRATVWMRHGGAGANLVVSYPTESGLPLVSAYMAPTGRATSDGWIELASNDFPVNGAELPAVYLKLQDYASEAGVDLDALELVPSGEFRPFATCEGVRDTSCGPDALCVAGTCRLGALGVPPLPSPELRDAVVDALADKLELFFGAKKTRNVDLPVALASIESMRDATTAYQFWGTWARAIRELHDWHTSASSTVESGGGTGRLNACFIEGDADLSHGVFPRHPVYHDILVSHAGPDGVGLHAGDRLVAVDGQHPIEWARGLIDVTWSYHIACDSDSFADLAEELGGRDGSILRYAKTISVIRCDAATGTCADTVENLRVKDMVSDGMGSNVSCDNRPSYHLSTGGPDPSTHRLRGQLYTGAISDTAPEEKIYGMVWDTLYGGGDPNGTVNSTISTQVAFWKASARGVILDHRAGNGGTLDAPENLTKLVRPKEVLAVVRMPIEVAGYSGPYTQAEGLALFEASKATVPYTVGDPAYDPTLPVALITHRDGSASDYLPLGMKGAPNVKLFGPGPTAGAFSTFIQFSYWGGINLQFASGETITSDGVAQLGTGVMPDVVVQQKQSDLLAGVDTIHEAALAWVRQELKP